MTRLCTIPECSRKYNARGWCEMHYARWRRHGDPNILYKQPSPLDRFAQAVRVTPYCWLWTKADNGVGYGVFHVDGRMTLAHRYSYSTFVGEIPAGYQVDHMCHNPSCVNPMHLRAVTQHQNMQNLAEPKEGSEGRVRGVSWLPKFNRWRVRVQYRGKGYYGGRFTDLEEARKASIALRNKLFTHNDLDRRNTQQQRDRKIN